MGSVLPGTGVALGAGVGVALLGLKLGWRMVPPVPPGTRAGAELA